MAFKGLLEVGVVFRGFILVNKHLKHAAGLKEKEEDSLTDPRGAFISAIDSFAKEFTILTLTLMGNSMANELTEMFGSDATLYTNMVEYFNSRFETDEIRQATIKQTVEEANIK